MEKYLLSILGSSVDCFYESDSWPKEGDFSHARYLSTSAGGPPLNVGAICAAKGCSVKALDMLGEDDDTTAFLMNELKRLNFDVSHVQIRKDVRNGKVIIVLSNGRRTMFVIDPIRPHYEMNDGLKDLLNGATYIYSLMHMLNRSFKTFEPLFEAKRNGAKIIIDGASQYEDPDMVRLLYELADGLFIDGTSYERLNERSCGEPKDILLDHGAQFLALTRGSKGASLYLKDREIHRPAVKNIDVVDPTGAGDAFAGCLLACLLKKMPYEKALSYACLSGAYACTVMGGLGGVASFEQLNDFAKEHHYDL